MRNWSAMVIWAILPLMMSAGAGADVDCYSEIDPYYLKVNVPSLIHIVTPDDVERIRKQIIHLLWPNGGLPTDRMPAEVKRLAPAETGGSPEQASPDVVPGWIQSIGSANLAHVDRLDVAMDYDMHSFIYHLHPKTANNRLLIFQMGHSDDILTAGGRETIRHFLDKGFAVVTLWMPLFGENTRIAKNVPNRGDVDLGTGTEGHNVMSKTIDDDKGCFIRFFIEPVVVAINHAEAKYDYTDINMTGVSGGGWTTHVAAAIDTRIRLSFPAAGSLPLYLRRGPCPNGSEGDAEQEWPALFEKIASWEDIYVMGGYGPGRGQVHILNQYDSCCFWGVNYRTFAPFVTDAVALLGDGSYEVWLDSSHREHKISDKAITEVIDKCLCGQHPSDGGREGR